MFTFDSSHSISISLSVCDFFVLPYFRLIFSSPTCSFQIFIVFFTCKLQICIRVKQAEQMKLTLIRSLESVKVSIQSAGVYPCFGPALLSPFSSFYAQSTYIKGARPECKIDLIAPDVSDSVCCCENWFFPAVWCLCCWAYCFIVFGVFYDAGSACKLLSWWCFAACFSFQDTNFV